MSDRSAASGTAAGVSHSILQQANPDCDTCASALTRSHKRYQERMEAIRNSERLERYYNELEFEYKNYRLTAERKIGRFEQNAAAYKAALENTIPLEEHNAKITQKVAESQVTFHERVANIERVLAEEKEALLVQLSNKRNELQSEKKHKELLVKKVGELKAEINSTSKEKANHEQAMSQLRDETTNQLRAKDQEIEWLKTTLRQREEQYRHDISAPSNHINRVQPTTPSSHNRAASNSVSHRNMHQTSPSSAATPLRTPNRGNGATASWMPLAHTPQQQRQPSQNNSNNTIQETAAVSQNEIPRSISSIIAQAPSATATPLQNGRKYRNVLTKPSNIDQSVMGQPTTLGARLTADQTSAMTRGTPALDPQNALQAVVVEQPSAFTPVPTFGLSQFDNQSAPEGRIPQSSAQPPQNNFTIWFVKKALADARAQLASGRANESHIAILSEDSTIRNLALHNCFNSMVKNGQGPALQRDYLKELQRFHEVQSQKASRMTAQPDSSLTMQSFAPNRGIATVPSQHNMFQSGSFQSGNPHDKQVEAPPPRRSPRLQTSQLANTSNNLHDAALKPNPTQQPPLFFPQNPMQALHGIETMRQSSNANNQTAPRLPKKSIPDTEWDSPVNPVDLYQGEIPTFTQPIPNGISQQPINPGYQLEDHDFEIKGTAYRPGSQNSGNVVSNFNNFLQQDVQLQNNNPRAFQQGDIRQGQTGTDDEIYYPNIRRFGTEIHLPSQQRASKRPPPRTTPRSPSRSPSRVSTRGGFRASAPTGIPDGGYRGVVCKNCHHEWWNTWCDKNSETCVNCQQAGVLCERPECTDFQNCKKINCKGAHEADNFRYTLEMPEGKRAMKRKNRMADDHDEPPRKRLMGHPVLED